MMDIILIILHVHNAMQYAQFAMDQQYQNVQTVFKGILFMIQHVKILYFNHYMNVNQIHVNMNF